MIQPDEHNVPGRKIPDQTVELTNEQAHRIANMAILQYLSRWAYPTSKGAYSLPGTLNLQSAIEDAIGEHPGGDPYPLKEKR
jgi:hypothetical protein